MHNPMVVLVIGPPRSGTSAISGALNAAGINFGNPDHFLNPDVCQHNPIFFELAELNALNDEIFALFGKQFTDSFRVTTELLNSDEVRALEDRMAQFLQREFDGNAPLIGLKDPRFCYTGPVWMRVLKKLNWDVTIVYVRRNAEECIRSNHKVNPRLSSQQLATLWVECTLAAHHLFRDTAMMEVDYNAIMAGDMNSLTRLLNELGISPEAQAAAAGFFNISQRHIKDVPHAENRYIQRIETAHTNGLDLAAEYQRYLEICSLQRAPEQRRSAPPLAHDHEDGESLHAQLYYARDGFFTENRSVFVPVISNRAETIAFEVQAQAGPLRLRLDPMRCPGVVEVSNARITLGEKTLWDSSRLHELTVSGTALQSRQEGAAHLLCWGDNPQLIFPEILIPESSCIRVEMYLFCDDSSETVQHVQEDIFAICRASMAEVEAMQQSLSWRITAPLRRLYEALVLRRHNVATTTPPFDFQQWISINEPTAEEQAKIAAQTDTPQWDMLVVDGNDGDALVDAAARSESEFCMVGGPHVQLADHALFMLGRELQRCPDAVLLYADEDGIDENGLRHSPFFKPDWNPDLFLSQNYLGPLVVIRRSKLLEWEPASGETLRDLLFVVTEQCAKHQIRHIPHILYHCTETRYPSQEERQADRIAIEKALARRGDSGTLTPCDDVGWKIAYRPRMKPTVEIIIPTHNQRDLLRICIDSIRTKTSYDNYHITIIDNRSDDPGTCAYLNELASNEQITVLRDDSPFNYSAINNRAVKQCASDFLLFLNNDTEVISPDWLSEMVALGMRPQTGAVGAKLLYPNRTVQHAGVIVGMGIAAGHAFVGRAEDDGGYRGRLDVTSNFSAVTAACMGIRRELFEEIGGFNEKQLAVAFNDVDLCLRLQQKGCWNVFTPNAVLCHHESVSRQDDLTGDGRNRLIKEVRAMTNAWPDVLANDPAYSPNLNLDPSFPSFSPAMNSRSTKPWRQL